MAAAVVLAAAVGAGTTACTPYTMQADPAAAGASGVVANQPVPAASTIDETAPVDPGATDSGTIPPQTDTSSSDAVTTDGGDTSTATSGTAATAGGSGKATTGGGTLGGVVAGPGHGVIIGTTNGGYDEAVAGTGVKLADHMYSQFNLAVPSSGAMITVGAGQTPWAQVAKAAPGSSLYNDIVRWAQALKSRGPVMVAYDHEPEAGTHAGLGTSADYVAAYRHVVDIFRQQGATNIEWTWQVTGFAFRVKPTDARYAAKWYPGDDVVDNVGADTYNSYTCMGNANASYSPLQPLAQPALDFARAHHKKASFPEYGSQADPRRADWLRTTHQFFLANSDVIDAAFYFNHPATGSFSSPCHWFLSTTDEFGALRDMAQDSNLVAP